MAWCGPQDEGPDPRVCPACGGRLGLKLARTGGFVGCSNYPTCRRARPLGVAGDADGDYAADMAGASQAMGNTSAVIAGGC